MAKSRPNLFPGIRNSIIKKRFFANQKKTPITFTSLLLGTKTSVTEEKSSAE